MFKYKKGEVNFAACIQPHLGTLILPGTILLTARYGLGTHQWLVIAASGPGLAPVALYTTPEVISRNLASFAFIHNMTG
ncbi:hypothetical protein GQ53DRAFT_414358 [Thozetella sp. PMI_491]|nr:hypothetical protein GQ53DRAFT_414358 [Thozetella sp. PMI_491]